MPASERRSTKAVIDIGADRLGEGLAAAAIQLFLVLPGEGSVRFILAATAVWSAGAAWLAFRLDRAYVKVLEKGLAGQTQCVAPPTSSRFMRPMPLCDAWPSCDRVIRCAPAPPWCQWTCRIRC
jgi:hypothetical protein